MDLEARVLRISREFAALFGYAAEEAAGRPVVDLIVPEDELEDSRAGFARVGSGERFVLSASAGARMARASMCRSSVRRSFSGES